MNRDSQDSLPHWLNGFARVTSSRSLIPEIDGLRCAAILFVFLLHLNHQVVPRSEITLKPQPESSIFNRLLESGEYGVQLFFAISGFILALPFARARFAGQNPGSLKHFYFRRLTRLEPPLLINVLILFTIQVVFLGVPALERLPHLLATIPYLHNALFHEDSLINPVIWSLEVEAQFYLLAPLLTLVFCLKKKALRRAALLAGFLGFAYLAKGIPRAYLPAQMEHFLVGFFLADLYLGRVQGNWSGLNESLEPARKAPEHERQAPYHRGEDPHFAEGRHRQQRAVHLP